VCVCVCVVCVCVLCVCVCGDGLIVYPHECYVCTGGRVVAHATLKKNCRVCANARRKTTKFQKHKTAGKMEKLGWVVSCNGDGHGDLNGEINQSKRGTQGGENCSGWRQLQHCESESRGE
jgi:hypothetical protein